MQVVRRLCLAIAVAGLAFAGSAATAQVGIPGKFEVTNLGAASYTIPIQVPPGVSGMEPRLALAYNSRGGNGVLGVGWSLTGLPSITRCPRTTPQDGVKGGVTNSANDRFCLDGQRLIRTSGTYGAPGSTYATEIESFVKITAFGSEGTGPRYFVAKTKDGQTVEFGNTDDSRILVAEQSTARAWSVNKVADNFGNVQTITYGLPSAIVNSTTEYNLYPLRIDYTSNPSRGLSATNRVEFNYEARPDKLKAYQGGKPFSTSVRLSGVTTMTNGAVVSTYAPTYELFGGTRSVIKSISQCAPGGLCNAATKFEVGNSAWGPYPFARVSAVNQAESTSVNGKWQSLDLNGDGRTDLVHLTETSGAYRSWLSKGDGGFTILEFTTTADTSLNTGSWQVLDVNGDGLTDLVHLTSTAGLIKVWLSKGDGDFAISQFSTSVDGDLTLGTWLAIDVNGDGLGDLVHLLPSENRDEPMRVWKSNGDGTFAVNAQAGSGGTRWSWPPNIHPSYNLYYSSKFQVLDADGDGLADIIQMVVMFPTCFGCADELRMFVRKSNGDGTFGAVSTLLRSAGAATYAWVDTMVPVDANQDGFTDFLWLSSLRRNSDGGFEPNNNAVLVVSKGDGTFDTVQAPVPGGTLVEGSWYPADVNGDGLLDAIHTPGDLAGGSYQVWRSNGDGTFTVTTQTQEADTCSSSCSDFKPGDFFGAGTPGFVRVDEKAVKAAWMLSSPPGALVTSVSNGLGNVTSWNFSTLSGLNSAYVRDIPSDSNTWTLTPAIPVVSSSRSRIASWADGNTGSISQLERTTHYSYGSARVERNGRGFLGFSWLQAKDFDTGMTRRSYFSQSFPTTGQVVRLGTGTGVNGAWDNLTLTTTTYECTLLDGGSSCPQAPGNRYFFYPSLVDSRQWDLDGTAMPRTQVVNSNPDAFGNLRRTETTVFNPDGTPTGHRKTVDNEYYNNESSWIIGRLIKSKVTSTDSDTSVVMPVVPGSGNLPPAPLPQANPSTRAAVLAVIFELLLSE
jgi:hypothetical protein